MEMGKMEKANRTNGFYFLELERFYLKECFRRRKYYK